ncbi:hypothetical protein TVNIR_3625 [Thioalkalivibrio nitratireducens DSM 14787]|uniref:Uncharacterized protein n=1 Tax=Thioalkalivibrio nitratireducens (strain DSM 14787 / UNIQEM 213 / ALEN2) TaxID=1255043 RepID=L0E218_THIND|nr:hypothetical protein TVNIR_3625 [Thioalkalivibrio nitratireducens DSM 14787]
MTPPERQPRIAAHDAVHERAAAFQAACERLATHAVPGPHAAAEPVPRRVGEADRLVRVRRAGDRGHGTEGLLVERCHAGPHAVEQRRRIVETGTVEPLTAREADRADLHAAGHLAVQLVTQIRARQRTEIGVLGHRIADLHPLDPGLQPRDELVGDVRLDDEPLRGDAGLAVVLKTRFQRLPDGPVEVRIREHDERIGAPQFEHRLLQRLAGRGRDRAPGALGPGEAGTPHPGIGDHAGDRVGADGQIPEHALGVTRLQEHLLKRRRATGHVCRVLQQHGVARQRRGDGLPQHLPVREVPGHHQQDRAQRLPGDQRTPRIRRHPLVGKEAGAVHGVIVAGDRAFLDFGPGFGEALAHFGGRLPGKRGRLCTQHRREALQRLNPLAQRDRRPVGETFLRSGKRRFQPVGRQHRERAEPLSGGRIDADQFVHGVALVWFAAGMRRVWRVWRWSMHGSIEGYAKRFRDGSCARHVDQECLPPRGHRLRRTPHRRAPDRQGHGRSRTDAPHGTASRPEGHARGGPGRGRPARSGHVGRFLCRGRCGHQPRRDPEREGSRRVRVPEGPY